MRTRRYLNVLMWLLGRISKSEWAVLEIRGLYAPTKDKPGESQIMLYASTYMAQSIVRDAFDRSLKDIMKDYQND